MATQPSDALTQLVKEIKQAIMLAQHRAGASGIKVTKAELALKMTFTKSVEGKISQLPIPIEFSGDLSHASVQTITVSLVPKPDLVTFAAKDVVASNLAEAIETIARGASEAAASEPSFSLDQATASIEIGTTKDGKVVLFIGGEGKSEVTHTITLTLGSASVQQS